MNSKLPSLRRKSFVINLEDEKSNTEMILNTDVPDQQPNELDNHEPRRQQHMPTPSPHSTPPSPLAHHLSATSIASPIPSQLHTSTSMIYQSGSKMSINTITATPSTATTSSTPTEITINMQAGLMKDQVRLDTGELTLKTLKEHACNFVDKKFPEHGLNRLTERLLLFRHDYNSKNLLLPINVVSEITEGSLIEIVVSANPPSDTVQIRPHSLVIHSYKSPAFCDFCGEMLFGLFHQGLKCEGCGLNYHKRCAYKIPNNCTYGRRRRSSTYLPVPNSPNGSSSDIGSVGGGAGGSVGCGSSGYGSITTTSTSTSDFHRTNSNGSLANDVKFLSASTSPVRERSRQLSNSTICSNSSSVSGRPAWVEKKFAERIRVPHTFVVHTYTRPTVCQHCRKLLKGLYRQGYQCKDCRFNAHKKCMDKVPQDCAGEAPKEWQEQHMEEDCMQDDRNGDSDNEDNNNNGNGGRHHHQQQINSKSNFICKEEENGSNGDYSANNSSSDDNQQRINNNDHRNNKNTESGINNNAANDIIGIDEDKMNRIVSETSSNNIPLMRIVQSVKHIKRRGSKVLKEGWLTHYTNKDPTKRSHYWRLDTKAITMFQNESTSKYYKEIPLQEILQINSNRNNKGNNNNNNHSNGINNNNGKTSPLLDYKFELKTQNVIYYVSENDDVARPWEMALRQGLMPVLFPNENGSAIDFKPNQNINNNLTTSPNNNNKNNNGNNNVFINYNNINANDENDNENSDISKQYQIFIDEILGAGQFGTVYGGVHRTSNRQVAIKVIDKTRFPHKQEAQLKNEVSILQNISHQGVVHLEKMFEDNKRIFVVMEKLSGDMLEMILNGENGRLSERVTKFLIYQILVALRYLHSQSICHCDLKPENVLLSSNSQFPQVKLCDFGFARIIGERSFRRSVVGTPAYLAPEVLKNKGYNRSLDMWSVGVIIYVSLSGTFPFNEEEDIGDQIKNAAFMYPPDIWKDISPKAIDLIGNLLRVKSRTRYTVDKSLVHLWLDDYYVWCDLRRLEKQVNSRWLTHESDEERWEEYRIKNKLPENDFGPIITTPKYEDDMDTPNEEENRDKFITKNDSFRRPKFDSAPINDVQSSTMMINNNNKQENGNGHSFMFQANNKNHTTSRL